MFLYFPIEKSSPAELFMGSPFLYKSGNRTSWLRESKGRASVSRITEVQRQSTLTFSYQGFLYREFGIRDVKQLVLPTLEPRYGETPTHT
jgi:hypothetical protein